MLRPTWDPFADFVGLRDQINRLFDESVARVSGRERVEGVPQRSWAPPVDILEDSDTIVVKADIPGLSQDQINVELEGDTLTIRGTRQIEEQSGPSCLRAERVSGPFMRTFTLTTPVQAEKVAATYRDGVLQVTIPKAEETKPKRIQITADGGK